LDLDQSLIKSTKNKILPTCSNILQIWNGQDYSLDNEFGRDHLPKTDTIKSIHSKKANWMIKHF
jgi:hypothetical protein